MATKETSPEVSSAAGRILQRKQPEWMPDDYWADVAMIAGSCMSQDETKGQGDEPVGHFDTRKIVEGRPVSVEWTDEDQRRWADEHRMDQKPEGDDPLGR